MRAKVAECDQFTVEEYLAMTTERPEGERWEPALGAFSVPVASLYRWTPVAKAAKGA